MLAFPAAYFFLYVSSAVSLPYMQLFLKAHGFSPSHVGVLQACQQIAGILGPLLIARLADRTGRFRLIILLAVAAAGAAWAALELTAPPGLAGFVPFMLLLGVSLNSLTPLLDGVASKQLTDPTHQYGRVRLLGSAGFIACSLALEFGGLIDGSSSFSILRAFLVAAAMFAVAAAFLPRAAAHPPEGHERAGARLGGFFWLGILVIFLGWVSLTSYNSFFSLFVQHELGTSNVSWVYAIAGLGEIPWFFFSGLLIRRFGLRGIMAFCLAVLVGRLVILSAVHGVAWIVATQLLHGITFGLFHAAAIQFVNRMVPHSQLGLGVALYLSLGVGLANFGGSLAGGFLIEWLGFGGFYLAYAAPAAAAVLILMAAGKRFEVAVARDPA
jgi:PPP family 3-phenylpropionic acid transporter